MFDKSRQIWYCLSMKDREKRRSEVVFTRLTPQERVDLESLAIDMGMYTSTLVRIAILSLLEEVGGKGIYENKHT